MIHRWLGSCTCCSCSRRKHMFVEVSMLFCSNWYYCLTAELNQIKTAILIKMTSRSGGRISGRKLFLRGLKTKQLLSQLVPRQIFQIFPTMRWVMGVALVPGFDLVFFVPLVNPPHWCVWKCGYSHNIAFFWGNVTISRVDLGCTHVQTNPSQCKMYMILYIYSSYVVRCIH